MSAEPDHTAPTTDPDEIENPIDAEDDDEQATIEGTIGEDGQGGVAALDPDDFSIQADPEDEEAVSDESGEYDPSAMSVGRLWTNVLGMGASVTTIRFADTDPADRKEVADNYSELARDMEIDRCVDLWAEQSGFGRNMDPMQGAILLSAMFCLSVAIQEPAAAEGVKQAFQSSLGDFRGESA